MSVVSGDDDVLACCGSVVSMSGAGHLHWDFQGAAVDRCRVLVPNDVVGPMMS